MKKFFGFASMLVAFCAASVFTSCGEDDDDEVIDNVEFSAATAVANTDGTITFQGEVTSEGKLKSLELIPVNEAGEEVGEAISLLGDEKSIKQKDEEGKFFITPLKEVKVPVALYRLKAKVKGNGKSSAILGRTYTFKIGNALSDFGSYLSFINGECYTLEVAKTKEASIDAIVGMDFGLMVQGTNTKLNNKARVNISENAVISSNLLIATYAVSNIQGNEAYISGVIFDSKTVTVDVSNIELSNGIED
ncbi:MAG: hypothetical protein IKR52_04150 [Paludibacteraceae bacterium]|nr:hypothetical protein [Paludibacteraceae bacterium]